MGDTYGYSPGPDYDEVYPAAQGFAEQEDTQREIDEEDERSSREAAELDEDPYGYGYGHQSLGY